MAGTTIRVVLVGGSGYAGFEAIRLLLRHGRVELAGVFGPAGEGVGPGADL
jgi:N-acetyl-gamma-glutamylphosphate reductase